MGWTIPDSERAIQNCILMIIWMNDLRFLHFAVHHLLVGFTVTRVVIDFDHQSVVRVNCPTIQNTSAMHCDNMMRFYKGHIKYY